MADRVYRMARWMVPWTALLLLLGQAVWAGEQETTAPGPVAVVGGEVVLLADGDYFPALIDGIDRARREILLSAFFFRTNGLPDHRPDVVLRHLGKAVLRGVRVEAVLERGPEGDNVSGDNAGTAEKLRTAGIRVCMDTPDRTTHAKLVVIDGRILFVGSHNLTQSALKYNRELSVRIDSPTLAEEALRYLRALCPGEGASGRLFHPGAGPP
jgi:phosphatidylserine/phosphatidylglycerophosphate/cardiolipin synthase-like enzyme